MLLSCFIAFWTSPTERFISRIPLPPDLVVPPATLASETALAADAYRLLRSFSSFLMLTILSFHSMNFFVTAVIPAMMPAGITKFCNKPKSLITKLRTFTRPVAASMATPNVPL